MKTRIPRVVAEESQATHSITVAEKLREDILQGVIPPGFRLRQVEVAARFGVSTTPVREAFATLAQEGLVLKDANRGVIVFQPSPAELREIYEIRRALEPLAVELAAPRMAPIDFQELYDIINEMRGVTDPAVRDYLNRKFHSTIYQHAQSNRLSTIIDQLRDTATAYLRFLSAHSPIATYRAEADAEHEKVVNLLRAGDAKGAAEAMREHLSGSQQKIEEVIQK